MTTKGELTAGGAVIVRGAASGFVQDVEVRSHRFNPDEPTPVGGTDKDPTPYTAQRRAFDGGDRTTSTFKNPCRGLRRV